MKFWYTDENGGKWKEGTPKMIKTALKVVCGLGSTPLVSLRFLDGSEFDKTNGERKSENCTYNRTGNEARANPLQCAHGYVLTGECPCCPRDRRILPKGKTMSANILWKPVKNDGIDLPVDLPSAFIQKLGEAFGDFPVTLEEGDADFLKGMSFMDEDPEAYEKLAKAVKKHKKIKVWAEY